MATLCPVALSNAELYAKEKEQEYMRLDGRNKRNTTVVL